MCFKIYNYDKLLTVPKRKINIKATRNFHGSLLRIRKLPKTNKRKLISSNTSVNSHNFRYNISDAQQFSEYHIQRNSIQSNLPVQPQVDLKNYQNINSKCFKTNVNFTNSSYQCYPPAENCYSTLVSSQDQTRVFQHEQQKFLFSECHVQRNNNRPSAPSQFQNQALFLL